MIFRHNLLDKSFVYDNEGYRSFYIEDFDNLLSRRPYEWERFLGDGSLCMLAPTVIDRWEDE